MIDVVRREQALVARQMPLQHGGPRCGTVASKKRGGKRNITTTTTMFLTRMEADVTRRKERLASLQERMWAHEEEEEGEGHAHASSSPTVGTKEKSRQQQQQPPHSLKPSAAPLPPSLSSTLPFSSSVNVRPVPLAVRRFFRAHRTHHNYWSSDALSTATSTPPPPLSTPGQRHARCSVPSWARSLVPPLTPSLPVPSSSSVRMAAYLPPPMKREVKIGTASLLFDVR